MTHVTRLGTAADHGDRAGRTLHCNHAVVMERLGGARYNIPLYDDMSDEGNRAKYIGARIAVTVLQ